MPTYSMVFIQKCVESVQCFSELSGQKKPAICGSEPGYWQAAPNLGRTPANCP